MPHRFNRTAITWSTQTVVAQQHLEIKTIRISMYKSLHHVCLTMVLTWFRLPASSGVALSSTLRRKPNAFNLLHQLQFLARSGISQDLTVKSLKAARETYVNWEMESVIIKILGLKPQPDLWTLCRQTNRCHRLPKPTAWVRRNQLQLSTFCKTFLQQSRNPSRNWFGILS